MEQAIALPLRWKKEFLQKNLFKCTGIILSKKWSTLTFLAGIGGNVRRYTIRLGAASAYDGSMSAAHRNSIMDHSSRDFH